MGRESIHTEYCVSDEFRLLKEVHGSVRQADVIFRHGFSTYRCIAIVAGRKVNGDDKTYVIMRGAYFVECSRPPSPIEHRPRVNRQDRRGMREIVAESRVMSRAMHSAILTETCVSGAYA
eukprot:scaffold251_cov101-Skeletonema_marinoi.AAC.6